MSESRIIDRMVTAIVIAQWKCADEFLQANHGMLIPTIEEIRSLIGHGINADDAELLIGHARTLAREANEGE